VRVIGNILQALGDKAQRLVAPHLWLDETAGFAADMWSLAGVIRKRDRRK
jgi:hypothetical protein